MASPNHVGQVLENALSSSANAPPMCDLTRLKAVDIANIMRHVDRVCGITGNIDAADVRIKAMEITVDRRRVREQLLSPGIKQRTDEWYAARHTLVTASDIAQALGLSKFGTQRDFFIKKVPPIPKDPPALPPLPPLKWGTMFEDVACALYTTRNNVRVHEFGLIPHPDPGVRLGASPDGITDDGVMLEIKCPFRRQITGEVPLQYYYQIQGQLEVCGLRRCDYLECEFSKYEDEEEFGFDVLTELDGHVDEDAIEVFASNGRERGVIAEFEREDDVFDESSDTPRTTRKNTSYAYSPLCPSRARLSDWKRDEVDSLCRRADHRLVRLHFWRLEKYSVVRVERDEAVVSQMLKDLALVWDDVLEMRADPQKFEEFVNNNRSGKRGVASSKATTTTITNKPRTTNMTSIDDTEVAASSRKKATVTTQSPLTAASFVDFEHHLS